MLKKRPIKILRIQSRICIGGPAIHTEILSRHLPEKKFTSLLVGGALDPQEHSKYEELKEKGVNIRIIESMKRDFNVFYDIKTIIKLYRLIKREKPDVVETHTAKAGFTGRIAAYLAKAPIILHVFHGHVFHNYFGKFKTHLIILIEKILAKISTRIIVISEQQQRDIVDIFKIVNRNKSKAIPYGFDLERFTNIVNGNGTLKTEMGISKKEFLIAIIGRIVPIKNHEMSFRVMKLLRQDGMDIHLCVIGDGELRQKHEKFVREKQVEKYVHFLGWRQDLENIYSSLDLLMLTSLNEGTPFTIIEAMAAGVPVVSTNVGGVSDVIENGETGFICNIDDDNEMAEKIKKILLNDRLKTRYTTKAKLFVKEKYSAKRMVNDMIKFYDELILSKFLINRISF